MKIDRALIIRRLQVPISIKYAEMCADSCEENNLPYEFIDAVEFLSCDDAFKSVGTFRQEKYKNKDGHCNVHASHIKCWKRIIELGKACIILEHDSIVKGDVRKLDLEDKCIYTFGHRVENKNLYTPPSPASKFVEIKRSFGVHACGITPLTAQLLWENARDEGIFTGVDNLLMIKKQSGFPLFVCEPPQVVCWTRVSTIDISYSNKDSNFSTPRFASNKTNFKETFTEGWNKGLSKKSKYMLQ